MSILSYFKWKETPSEYLERAEVECVVTEPKSVESKGEWWCKFKIKVCFWEMNTNFYHISSSKWLYWVEDRTEKFFV